MIPVLVAIDTFDEEHALTIMSACSGRTSGIKVGLEYFCHHGVDGVRRLKDKSYDAKLFLDLKFKDVPNTVIHALRAFSKVSADFISIHVDSGVDVLRAASKEILNFSYIPELIGVTVLTSIGENEPTLPSENIQSRVLQLAKIGLDCGLHGAVCSPLEVTLLRKSLNEHATLIVPGVRLPNALKDDQVRVNSPKQALSDGADYVVVGRHINRKKTFGEIVDALDELERHLEM